MSDLILWAWQVFDSGVQVFIVLALVRIGNILVSIHRSTKHNSETIWQQLERIADK